MTAARPPRPIWAQAANPDLCVILPQPVPDPGSTLAKKPTLFGSGSQPGTSPGFPI